MQTEATTKMEWTSALIKKPLINDIMGPIIRVRDVEIDVIVPLNWGGVSAWIMVKKFACDQTQPKDTMA